MARLFMAEQGLRYQRTGPSQAGLIVRTANEDRSAWSEDTERYC